MANSIGLASVYTTLLDKVYEGASVTRMLEAKNVYTNEALPAGTFYVPKISLVGLGNYSKTAGYPAGDATFSYVAHSYSFDRGRKFAIDAMDNQETAGLAFGAVAEAFIKDEVVPEVDAIRFEALAQGAGTSTYGALSSSANWVSAIDTGIAALGDASVPMSNMVAFVSWAGYNYLKNSTPSASRFTAPGASIDRRFAQWDGIDVVPVPADRFYENITLNAGATSGVGGYSAPGGALNFILMDKGAAFADAKHAPLRIFRPEENQDADAWVFQYRLYHDIFVLDNKAEGIYAHSVTEIS